jgi:hypothetical protein
MSKRNLKKLRKENESLKEMCARKMAPSAYSGGYPFSISGDIRSLPS